MSLRKTGTSNDQRVTEEEPQTEELRRTASGPNAWTSETSERLDDDTRRAIIDGDA